MNIKTLTGMCVALAAMAAGAYELDGVAAKVGSETILRSDVVNEMRRMGERDGSRFNEVRNRMIDHKLILKAANESKMTMQEWVVENRIREIIKKAFGGDRNKLIETLGKQKISYPEWYAKMKEDMIVGAMRWNVIDKNVTASPSDMRREFEEHRERYAKDRKVTVSVIMLRPEERANREKISADLKEKSFAELGGRTYKDVVPENVFQRPICQAIDKMPKGTISTWIEIDGWNFLLRKEDETAGHEQDFEEAYTEIEANVKEGIAKKLYDEWIARLREETYIKVFD